MSPLPDESPGVYAGRAETGFSEKMLKEWYERLLPDAREDPPGYGPVKSPDEEPPPLESIPEVKTTTWVEPKIRRPDAVHRMDARTSAAPSSLHSRAGRQAR